MQFQAVAKDKAAVFTLSDALHYAKTHKSKIYSMIAIGRSTILVKNSIPRRYSLRNWISSTAAYLKKQETTSNCSLSTYRKPLSGK
ncbi:MAG: hypothetical protein MJY54_01290 [archaeon]|nr:hypothetical protein [archaeon]